MFIVLTFTHYSPLFHGSMKKTLILSKDNNEENSYFIKRQQ